MEQLPEFLIYQYQLSEKELINIFHYVTPVRDLNASNYKFGSEKLTDFCIKVGTRIDTCFHNIFDFPYFLDIPNGDKKNQNIGTYNKYLLTPFGLNNFEVAINQIGIIKPAADINDWYLKYSKYKHQITELLTGWTLLHSIKALALLKILVIVFLKGNPPNEISDISSCDMYRLRYIREVLLKKKFPKITI